MNANNEMNRAIATGFIDMGGGPPALTNQQGSVIASVVRLGAGSYQVNFNEPLNSRDYYLMVSCFVTVAAPLNVTHSVIWDAANLFAQIRTTNSEGQPDTSLRWWLVEMIPGNVAN